VEADWKVERSGSGITKVKIGGGQEVKWDSTKQHDAKEGSDMILHMRSRNKKSASRKQRQGQGTLVGDVQDSPMDQGPQNGNMAAASSCKRC